MTRVVISQPMFFPWRGLFEQIRLADIYIHLVDVPLPQGRSMMNRVQVKTPQGNPWLSAPIQHQTGPLIQDVEFTSENQWRKNHLATLKQWYKKTPYGSEMLELAESLYQYDSEHLADFNRNAIETIAQYFKLNTQFMDSSTFNIQAKGSEKMLGLVKAVGGNEYITGHGAKKYLNHTEFERQNITVSYMDYQNEVYPQLYEPFIPFVSSLDLIANTGANGRDKINSGVISWQQVMNAP